MNFTCSLLDQFLNDTKILLHTQTSHGNCWWPIIDLGLIVSHVRALNNKGFFALAHILSLPFGTIFIPLLNCHYYCLLATLL